MAFLPLTVGLVGFIDLVIVLHFCISLLQMTKQHFTASPYSIVGADTFVHWSEQS